jgi:hypothetical protein
MTVAVLVLGFREPNVLSLVIPVYRQAGFDIFLHLDAKAAILPYARALGGQAQYCRFLEKRRAIFWGGFSMVEAAIELLGTAFATGLYSNFLLVSDDTLPVVPVKRLREALTAGVDRISMRKLAEDDIFYQRYSRFFLLDHQATSLLGRPIEKSFLDEAFFEKLVRLENLRATGKVQIPLYYGSQWWCLTNETARTILALNAEQDRLRQSFEFSAVPDEMYIQTLVSNHTKNKIAGGPVYVDWSREPKPYVFSDESYNNDIHDYQFLIRKVSMRDSAFVERMTLSALANKQ